MPDSLDIQPISPRFFSNVVRDPGMTQSAKERLVDSALQGRLSLEKTRSELVNLRQREELTSLRLERERLLLDDARYEATRKRDVAGEAVVVGRQISEIFDDAALTPEEKHQALARVRLANADKFTYSRELRDQFAAAAGALPAPLTEYQKQAQQRYAIAELQDAREREIKLEEEARKEYLGTVDDQQAAFEKDLERIGRLKFNQPDALSDADPTALQNANDRYWMVNFLNLHAGVDPDSVSALSDAELYKRVLEVAPAKRREFEQRRAAGRQHTSPAAGPNPSGIPLE